MMNYDLFKFLLRNNTLKKIQEEEELRELAAFISKIRMRKRLSFEWRILYQISYINNLATHITEIPAKNTRKTATDFLTLSIFLISGTKSDEER